jgi:2-succinyl-5-enolpyruvyl-6-hydroxy-3-cyclohexene-1-carboxylate synthase
VDSKNFQSFWCMKLIEFLAARGFYHYFLAPGSRNTPLISAIVRHNTSRIHVGVDERSLGFMALGFAKRTRQPAIVVMTSGTAVANLYPAVAEAFESEVPLIIFSADRPYELRDCGSNQTINQVGMFANHIKKSLDLAPPSVQMPWEAPIKLVERAISNALLVVQGPVHCNFQFREPLNNCENSWEERTFSDFITSENSLSLSAQNSVWNAHDLAELMQQKRGLIVVGGMHPATEQESILSLAERTGWPIYADILSNLRLVNHPQILHHFDVMLMNSHFTSEIRFDAIIKFGGRLVSKRFWQWLAEARIDVLLSANASSKNLDASSMFSEVPWSSVQQLFEKEDFVPSKIDGVQTGLEAQPKLKQVIGNFMETASVSEAFYATRLCRLISRPCNLFVSSSMPIRYLDFFAAPTEADIHVYSNRGVSGIDGILSSAAGMAVESDRANMVLIGDLAFIHDTNGLMLLAASAAPVLVVVINNFSGGIFHFLPIGQEADVISPFLTTPHQVDIGKLCEAHHLEYEKLNTPKQFDEAVKNYLVGSQTKIIEICFDVAQNVEIQNKLYREIKELC